MTPWKVTLESSPDFDPDIVFSEIPVPDAKKFVLSIVEPLNNLVKHIPVVGLYITLLPSMLKKLKKPMRGDMVVKASLDFGGKSLPDIYLKIKGDKNA